MAAVVRIRLTRIPSARDLEYLALRYLKGNGVYDAPLEIANDLVELGYAFPTSDSEALTDLDDRFLDIQKTDDDDD